MKKSGYLVLNLKGLTQLRKETVNMQKQIGQKVRDSAQSMASSYMKHPKYYCVTSEGKYGFFTYVGSADEKTQEIDMEHNILLKAAESNRS